MQQRCNGREDVDIEETLIFDVNSDDGSFDTPSQCLTAMIMYQAEHERVLVSFVQ